jgi:predicted alpha/beta superfamily hydrolase
MKCLFCVSIFLLAFSLTEAQHTVVFKIKKNPAGHRGDNVFIAGNFNGWEPHNTAYRLAANWDNVLELAFQLPKGEYEYKFTRGAWERVECMNDGKDMANRYINIQSDTSIDINIDGWKDDFATVTVQKEHTAGKQVRIMDSVFLIPQLNRTRRIWVYLPEDYATSKKRYPVLYMHDGQNLFDYNTSDNDEWGIDETLDSLIAKGKQPAIVIGIDNGGDSRMSEYNLREFVLETDEVTRKFRPEGKEYIDFLAHTLKPYIDKKYRTLTDRNNTIIAGSSMGALISYYAMLTKPDVFGKAGIFSPSFWTNPSIGSFTDSLARKINSKFFFYAGAKESDSMIDDMHAVQDVLGAESSSMIYTVTDPEGAHNAKSWRKWFAEFYVWIMADGFNTVIKMK